MLLWWLGCTGDKDNGAPDDSATSPTDDTGLPAPCESTVADDGVRIVGTASDGAGNAVAFAGDEDGDGDRELVVAASFHGKICVFDGALGAGEVALADARTCWTQEATNDYAGISVANVGDTDRDGFDDLLVGAALSSRGDTLAGQAYLLYGPQPQGTVSLSEAETTFFGEVRGDQAGTAVAAAGDVDGDGTGDLLVGSPSNAQGGTGAGKAYLLRGPFEAGAGSLLSAPVSFTGSSFTGSSSAGAAPPPHGIPADGDALGQSLATARDFDGDGLDDVVIPAIGADVDGVVDVGAVGIFFGPVADGTHALDTADRLYVGAVTGEYVGDSVATGGDLTGDGLADVLVASDMNAAGTVWVLAGPGVEGGPVSIGEAYASIAGVATGDQTGAAMQGDADWDGDGQADFVVGAYQRDDCVIDGGAVSLVLGPVAPGASSLADVAARTWFGEEASDEAGRALALGDADGDGLADLLVGAHYSDRGGAFGGQAYLVWGGE